MKKILFIFAPLLICGALHAQEAYGVRTAYVKGIGTANMSNTTNTANTAVSKSASSDDPGSITDLPGVTFGNTNSIMDCMENSDGKARGICLSRLHKDGKPIDSGITMFQIASGCQDILSPMPSFDNCATVHRTTANRLRQRNHIECCSWANLGVNTEARQACCGYMWKPKAVCILYYKGQCRGPNGGPMQNTRYNTFACNWVKDKDPWCGGESDGPSGEEGNGNSGTGSDSGPDKPTLADCKKITDGEKRGRCLAKLPDMKEREAGCEGVGEHLMKYPNNCVGGSAKNNANIAYKENYLACCTFAELGANSGYRQRCCKAMPSLGCINYYKGDFQPARGKYLSNACILIPDNKV